MNWAEVERAHIITERDNLREEIARLRAENTALIQRAVYAADMRKAAEYAAGMRKAAEQRAGALEETLRSVREALDGHGANGRDGCELCEAAALIDATLTRAAPASSA